MAVFRAGAFRANFDRFNINALVNGKVTVASSTAFQIEIEPSDHVTFGGSGITYTASKAIIGGTINSLYETLHGMTLFQFTGFKASAAGLYAKGLSRDKDGFLQMILNKSDKLYGSSSKDHLKGFSGNDIIKANGGNDTLAGGSGNDRLWGGSGDDKFVFNTKDSGRDQIMDFNPWQDKIAIDQTGEWNGQLQFHQLALGTSAKDADDRVIYDQSTGSISYDPDGTDYRPQMLLANVKAGLYLTHDNFILI